MIDRERKVNLEVMSPEEISALSIQIGDKVRIICDEAIEKTNKFLKIYGMSAKMQIILDHEGLIKLPVKPKNKRSRKAANL